MTRQEALYAAATKSASKHRAAVVIRGTGKGDYRATTHLPDAGPFLFPERAADVLAASAAPAADAGHPASRGPVTNSGPTTTATSFCAEPVEAVFVNDYLIWSLRPLIDRPQNYYGQLVPTLREALARALAERQANKKEKP
jgi:hypothetical protein